MNDNISYIFVQLEEFGKSNDGVSYNRNKNLPSADEIYKISNAVKESKIKAIIPKILDYIGKSIILFAKDGKFYTNFYIVNYTSSRIEDYEFDESKDAINIKFNNKQLIRSIIRKDDKCEDFVKDRGIMIFDNTIDKKYLLPIIKKSLNDNGFHIDIFFANNPILSFININWERKDK